MTCNDNVTHHQICVINVAFICHILQVFSYMPDLPENRNQLTKKVQKIIIISGYCVDVFSHVKCKEKNNKHLY